MKMDVARQIVDRHYLTPLFEPGSVAIVGASEKSGKVGAVLLSNMLAAGYRGALFAVNPKYGSVRGVPCYASVGKLPRRVDLAVIATPAKTVPDVIEESGRSGVRAAVVITAGFSEAGPEGAKLERALLDNARRHGVRIVGPNCLGILRPELGLNATFAHGTALAGSLGLVSQSGAVCAAMVDWAAPNKIGFSSVVSLGASTDIDFGEIVDYLANDPKTEHILLYIEGIRDARRFLSGLRAAARVKPVIVMKVGRHPAGSRAAVSHTGAIVGTDGVLTILTPQAMTDAEETARAVADTARGAAKPLITCWMGEASVAAARKLLQDASIPVFRTPDPAVEMFAHLAAFYRNQRSLLQTPGPLAHQAAPDVQGARAAIEPVIAEGRKVLSETESKALLAAFHIPIAQTVLARSARDAVLMAQEIGFPVAVKIDSPDITHKSDVGGVRLNLASAEAVRSAYQEMIEEVGRKRPQARLNGVTVEPMIARERSRADD